MKLNIKHGATTGGKPERLYRIWGDMRQRCNNQNHKLFKSYSNRRIAKVYGVGRTAINNIANNKTYKEELCPI